MGRKKISSERDPIDLAVEKNINKVGSAIVWAIKMPFRFLFIVPKDKYERAYKKMIVTGLFLILIGWILVVIGENHLFGL